MSNEKDLLSSCTGNCEGCSACDDKMTVTLQLDDGATCECAILTILEVGENNYIVLLPQNPPKGEEGEVYIYRYLQDENGNPDLDNILDDDEFEAVSDAFDEWLDSCEYDELVDGDDEDEDDEEDGEE